MQSSRILHLRVCGFLCLGLLFAIAASARPIRLQNETIQPAAQRMAVAAAPETIPADSLALIQFNGPPQSDWRDQLEKLGVRFIRYVPEDAFIADLHGIAPDRLRALNFIAWLGPYRPDHKIHRGLTQTSSATNTQARAAAASEAISISVLLSPGAPAAEAQNARGLLNRVGQESRLRSGTVLRGEINPGQLQSLARSRAVLWIEPAPQIKLFDEVSSDIVAGEGPLGQTSMQSLGYDGAGVTVAVADSGLDSGDTNSMHPDIQGRVVALFHYGFPGQLEDAADEHSHGTHVAGIIAGDGTAGEVDENGFLYGLGVAPGASLIGQRLFDAVGNYAAPQSGFEQLTREAKRAGAEIGSNSWGDDTQGRYDISAMEFDELVRDADALALGDQAYILEFSAGNAGPGQRTIGSPAVAKNVIATGASNNDRRNLPIEEFTIYDTGPDTMADFSSRGPCDDGRIKPDLVAPGSWIASLRSIYANDDFAWWPISQNYMYQGGTSQAGPAVSGAAAVFVQYYRALHGGATPSPALVKAALINSATDMDDSVETLPAPNNDEGWGRVNLPALVGSPRDYDFLDQAVLLTNNAVNEKRVLIGSADEPFKVTLTYTDVPGNPAAAIALVNDLDLEVVSPDGQIYRGNRFDFGESVPGAGGTDTINNIEGVHLFAPVPGEYIIRVRATRVVEDARRDTAVRDQDFALVVSGAFSTPGVGIVTFNQPVYRAPDMIRLMLVDYDLAGQPSVNLTVRSGAEPAGEVVTLSAHGASGLFTGAVATATSPGSGQLQIAHGNVIEAVYADAAPAAIRVYSALADLQPPIITNVRATNEFGQITVSWNTDEAARAIVYFGTNTPNVALTNTAFDVAHQLPLPDFPDGAVIRYFAVAQDVAGNRATNNNGGSFFTITNVRPPAVFLLDSYTDSGGFIAAPPLAGYTDALNALGRAYSVFDGTTGAEPTLSQLQSHRCVIWRVDEISPPTGSLVQKITDYVNSGGSLLIASMEALTRITEAGMPGFNTTILQVQSYTEDQPVNEILGTPGDPVGAGMDIALDYTPYEELITFLQLIGVNDPSDWVSPNTNAAAVLLADGSVVGVRSPKAGVDLPGRVVYLSFPLDAVPMGGGVGNNRPGLLFNILNFLAPAPGSSTLALDSDVYSVPARAIIEVEDLDLQGLGEASVTVSSPHQTNSITLYETVRPGLFRGNVFLTPTNSGFPGTLMAQADDTVTVNYFDASPGQSLTATAFIETNAPIISGVFIEPGYLEAVVSWDTSEEADSLVQYSESPDSFPINFTAYDATRSTYHEVFLSGLKPNTTYYLRVSSRDRAGNTTVDNNDGQLYTFITLQPLAPPWSDNMETNSLNWSVIVADESESQWTRGVPGGGETAYSGSNCWGSNLDGGPLTQTEGYLISPGILLAGGNRATLRFWQNYDLIPQGDFEFQLAGLFIITNISTSPVLLTQLPEDTSFGWEEVVIDLTPYMGNVVYIAWYHFLFSFDGFPQMGWLVDDASITVDTVSYGTVQITNNVWQAVYALNGPTGGTGRGRWTTITNAAAGEYTIQFGDVPFHNTPASQIQNLSTGSTITFNGQYTFPDANSNGIPDGWEQAYFGEVSPTRTISTDTDSDGLSDYAEYVAGSSPTNSLSKLELEPSLAPVTGNLSLQWPSAPGHGYRVLGSSDVIPWTPVTDWIRASSTVTGTNLPTASSVPRFFRVEVQP